MKEAARKSDHQHTINLLVVIRASLVQPRELGVGVEYTTLALLLLLFLKLSMFSLMVTLLCLVVHYLLARARRE